MANETNIVRALAEPIVDRAGLELVDLEVKAGRGSGLVRVVVDRKGGVPLGICQEVSRELSMRLDEEDPVDSRYALEVTSPGIDWPLRDQGAFDRVEGREVMVHYQEAQGHEESSDQGDGERRVLQASGRVLAAEANAVRLAVDDEELRISYDDIVKATQKLPW